MNHKFKFKVGDLAQQINWIKDLDLKFIVMITKIRPVLENDCRLMHLGKYQYTCLIVHNSYNTLTIGNTFIAEINDFENRYELATNSNLVNHDDKK